MLSSVEYLKKPCTVSIRNTYHSTCYHHIDGRNTFKQLLYTVLFKVKTLDQMFIINVYNKCYICMNFAHMAIKTGHCRLHVP